MEKINSIAAEYIAKIQKKCELIQPLVVIRCITYNQGLYLRDTLEGFIKQQTDFPFVAVVHDDASKDNNQDIINEFAAKYPDIILPILEIDNQFSKGGKYLKGIMDKACEATSAKYIAFCEGDDYWIDKHKLQKQVNILNNNPEISLVHTGFKVREGNKDFLNSTYFERYKRKSKSGDFFYKLLKGNYILTCTVMVRKELFHSEFYLEAPLSLDYLYFISAALMGKAYYIKDNTSVYRRIATGQMLSNFKAIKERGAIITSYTSIFYLKHQFPKFNFLTNLKIKSYIGERFLKKRIKDPINNKVVTIFQYPALLPYLPISVSYLLYHIIKNKSQMTAKSILSKLPGVNKFRKLRTKLKYSKYNKITVGREFRGKISRDIIGKNNIVIIGEKCHLENLKIHIRGTGNVIEIGSNVYFGPGNSIWAEGSNNKISIGERCTFTQHNHINAQENNTHITISKDCMISNNVIIRTSDSHPIYDKNTHERLNPAQNIEIGEHVWIAPNVKIMKGTKIASGCIIGSDTTVNKIFDTPNSLIIGRPAKILRTEIEWSRETLY